MCLIWTEYFHIFFDINFVNLKFFVKWLFTLKEPECCPQSNKFILAVFPLSLLKLLFFTCPTSYFQLKYKICNDYFRPLSRFPFWWQPSQPSHPGGRISTVDNIIHCKWKIETQAFFCCRLIGPTSHSCQPRLVRVGIFTRKYKFGFKQIF